MPKWPRSSGPVRNELSCCTVMGTVPLGRRVDIARLGHARCADESENLVRILHARSTLYAGGYIDAGGAGDAQSLADIVGIEAAGQHEGHARIDILQQTPIDSVTEPTWAGGVARRARIKQQPIGHRGVSGDAVEITLNCNRHGLHYRQAECRTERLDAIGGFGPVQLQHIWLQSLDDRLEKFF